MSDETLFDLSLDELSTQRVNSVEFFETSLARSPSNIYVIDYRDIANRPALTLQDFIQNFVPGAHISSQGFVGQDFASRGLAIGGSVKTLVMWDGHNLNMRAAGGYRAGYFSSLLGDIDKIEVVLGPSSLMHGTGALNGFVNLVPKAGLNHQGARTELTAGPSDELIRIETEYGRRYGEERHLYVYGGFVQANGIRFDDDFGGAEFDPIRFSNRERVLEYEPSFKLSTNWVHDNFSLVAMFDRLRVDPNSFLVNFNQIIDKTIFTVQPRYTLHLSRSETLEFAPAITLIDSGRTFSHRFSDDAGQFDEGGSESNSVMRMTVQSQRFDRHRITLGAAYHWRKLRSLDRFFSAAADTDAQNTAGRWDEYAVFGEDRITLSDRWDVDNWPARGSNTLSAVSKLGRAKARI